jgi:hypothetical protein
MRPGWVVSRSRLQKEGLGPLNRSTSRCGRCNLGVVYHSQEAASSHLRTGHTVGSMSDHHIRAFLQPVSSAAQERLGEDRLEVLGICRDRMRPILQELIDIQNSTLDMHGTFRDPSRGVPYPLLNSFKLVMAVICAVPNVLDENYEHYAKRVLRSRTKSLESSNYRRHKQMLLAMGSDSRISANKAKILLQWSGMTKIFSGLEYPPLRIGVHSLASQIVANLVKIPVENHKSAATLYTDYVKYSVSHYMHHADSSWSHKTGRFFLELCSVSEFVELQKGALWALRMVLLLGKDSHHTMLSCWEEEAMKSRLRSLRREEDKMKKLVDLVVSWIGPSYDEITKAVDGNQLPQPPTLSIRLMTMVSLVLAAIAVLSTMTEAGRGWGVGQVALWQVLAPLAFGTSVFCFGAAHGNLLLRGLDRVLST